MLLKKEVQKIKGLKDFAKKHNLKIHPKRTFVQWAELVVLYGKCPCDPKRPDCPCDKALAEIEKMGHCFCKFFYRED